MTTYEGADPAGNPIRVRLSNADDAKSYVVIVGFHIHEERWSYGGIFSTCDERLPKAFAGFESMGHLSAVEIIPMRKVKA